ncbi:MAG: transposase [Thermodesulfobacteriota bacterium]|nr:transposase [Thermodesulfobacteriota bacterium]
MPRQPRLDAPGLLQHVMARGIERREIFKDDQDRQSFLERLAVILEETQTQCYAWALIPNHFHLLLRTGLTPLSKVMRRLMTGYAVTFNKRHKRSGHLFQNRYKSVVCEEDPYLLELIRYIHLNPLRAGLVKDLKELDKYPWTGHSAIMGKRKNSLAPCPSPKNRFTPLNCSEGAPKGIQLGPEKPEKYLVEKTIEDVLLQFGDKLREARRRYRQFVKSGVDQGSRPELQGGGLVRSAGGDKSGLLGRKKEERELRDARILGSGDFVSAILQDANELEERKTNYGIGLDELIMRVTGDIGIDMEDLLSSKREQKISNARAIISYLAAIKLGYNGTSLAKVLRMSRKSASRSIKRGKKMLDNNPKMLEYLA